MTQATQINAEEAILSKTDWTFAAINNQYIGSGAADGSTSNYGSDPTVLTLFDLAPYKTVKLFYTGATFVTANPLMFIQYYTSAAQVSLGIISQGWGPAVGTNGALILMTDSLAPGSYAASGNPGFNTPMVVIPKPRYCLPLFVANSCTGFASFRLHMYGIRG